MLAKYVPVTRSAQAKGIFKLARSGALPWVVRRNSHIPVVTVILVQVYCLLNFILVDTERPD